MGYLKERIKHAVRFRHKRGFGVHSPFMFNLILNVIRDRDRTFDYPLEWEKGNLLSRRERKIFRLLSRLIRHLEVRRMVCTGENAALLTEYLETACPQVLLTSCLEEVGEADFIYVGRRMPGEKTALDWGAFMRNEPKYAVISDIYKDKQHARLWRLLRERATVSVDMMWYGILFFNDKIQRGKYNLTI